jgi:hypothetical protein
MDGWLGLNSETVGLNTGASTAGLNSGALTAGLNAGTSGLKSGASGLKEGAVTLRVDMPSMLVLLLAELGSAGDLSAGANDEKLDDKEGLKEAAGLNLNSLASTLSLEIDEFDVCLLCISEAGFPNASFASLHELLT